MPLPIGISVAEGPRSNSAGLQCGPRVSSPNQMESSVIEESSDLPDFDETMMLETKPPVDIFGEKGTLVASQWSHELCHTVIPKKVSPKLLGGWFGGLKKWNYQLSKHKMSTILLQLLLWLKAFTRPQWISHRWGVASLHTPLLQSHCKRILSLQRAHLTIECNVLNLEGYVSYVLMAFWNHIKLSRNAAGISRSQHWDCVAFSMGKFYDCASHVLEIVCPTWI